MTPRKLAILMGNTENLGDAIITVATNNIVAANCIFDRDTGKHLSSCSDLRSHRVLVTGWLTHNPENWPIKMQEAKFTSIHVSKTLRNNAKSSDLFFNKKTIEKMRESGPIGCRDSSTLDLVRNFGLEGNFSGCITMTLTSKEVPTKRRIALVDTSSDITEYFKGIKQYEVIEIAHDLPPRTKWSKKLNQAQQLIDIYKTCEFVISTRLHAVIPALALGAKSCLIVENMNDDRFQPLRNYIPSIEKGEINSLSKVLDSAQKASPSYLELSQSLEADISAWL